MTVVLMNGVLFAVYSKRGMLFGVIAAGATQVFIRSCVSLTAAFSAFFLGSLDIRAAVVNDTFVKPAHGVALKLIVERQASRCSLWE